MKDLLKRVKTQMVGQALYADEIQAIFQEELDPLGVEVTTHPYGDDIGANQITANGYFDETELEMEDPLIEAVLVDIELVLILNNEDRPITINNKDWKFLEHQVTQTLEHEMIHREQAKKRIGANYMPIYNQHMDEEQKRIVYLSDPDEIDAYANDVALDLLLHYTYMGAYARLREYKQIRQEESPIFCEYVDTFGWNSETVHILVKKALKRLET
jgi:hypothetical protein